MKQFGLFIAVLNFSQCLNSFQGSLSVLETHSFVLLVLMTVLLCVSYDFSGVVVSYDFSGVVHMK